MSYILAVEDDMVSQLILNDYLSDQYEIKIVDDGLKCLESVKDRIPDLILLDILIPKLDGYSVCKTLKAEEQYKNIPIIFVTSYASNTEKEKGYEVGADAYVSKPYEIDDLLAVINKYTQ